MSPAHWPRLPRCFRAASGLPSQIQAAVRGLPPAIPGYKNFTVTVNAGALTMTSGSSGTGSSVVLFAAAANDLAGPLNLLAGAVLTPAKDLNLAGGNDTP